MKKSILILMIGLLIISGCDKQISKKPFCQSPYIEYMKGNCCLDNDLNNVCDTDEKEIKLTVINNTTIKNDSEPKIEIKFPPFFIGNRQFFSLLSDTSCVYFVVNDKASASYVATILDLAKTIQNSHIKYDHKCSSVMLSSEFNIKNKGTSIIVGNPCENELVSNIINVSCKQWQESQKSFSQVVKYNNLNILIVAEENEQKTVESINGLIDLVKTI